MLADKQTDTTRTTLFYKSHVWAYMYIPMVLFSANKQKKPMLFGKHVLNQTNAPLYSWSRHSY